MKDDLTLTPVLVAVAEAKSFTRAAKALGVSTSAVSQAIARLETTLGAALVVRTTRSVNLTEAGAELAAAASPALTSLRAAVAQTRSRSKELTGTLRLNVPRMATALVLDRVLPAYLRAHPRMQVEVTVDDRSIDIVAQGYDAGIRLYESVQRDMISVVLTGQLRFVVVASPRYLKQRGTPRHPRELVHHDCLNVRMATSGRIYPWEFTRGKKEVEVNVRGRITSNDVDVLRGAAREDLGFAYLPEGDVRGEIAAGALVTVLDAWLPPIPGLYLYFPRAARTLPKLAAFVALARGQS